jgi:hypothetical protein
MYHPDIALDLAKAHMDDLERAARAASMPSQRRVRRQIRRRLRALFGRHVRGNTTPVTPRAAR